MQALWLQTAQDQCQSVHMINVHNSKACDTPMQHPARMLAAQEQQQVKSGVPAGFLGAAGVLETQQRSLETLAGCFD